MCTCTHYLFENLLLTTKINNIIPLSLSLFLFFFFLFRLPIEVSFTAVDKREFIFHLTCNVKKKPTPLILNVKADVYAINLSLSATDTDGCETSLPVDRIAVRTIDFGKVSIIEALVLRVIHNTCIILLILLC